VLFRLPGLPASVRGAKYHNAGALKIYVDKLKGKCLEDDVVIDKGNEYLGKKIYNLI
jgi:hypothetical protein